ncbi:hypothetical protein HDU79_000209 [Rhizoclosmatium sp. JEL0117]|nr:hypothetical protein HDU79_000209 [Rhizoclosmatium sp. JEL0117]
MLATYKAATVSLENGIQNQLWSNWSITAYGYDDNDDGNGRYFTSKIAYPFIHKVSTEDLGTFDRPSTFAADETFFIPGEKIYIPHLRKYFVYEDGCVECTADQRKGLLRVDLYIGEAKRQGRALIVCERAVTIMNSGSVILNPTSEWPVVEGKVFWDGKCAYPTESYPSGAQIIHSVSSFLFAIIILI